MKRINNQLILVAAVVLTVAFVAPQSAARELPEGVTELTTVEGITEYQLDNGLRFILFPDRSKQQITVNVTYLVGSRHEGYGESGMAHLLEHLVFKGTPNHPNIPAELTERGAFPNGTTWFDRTNYFETFPATDENLEWALDLEADRMVNSFISAEDLESEMTVVRNEWERGENSPERVLQQRVMSAAYAWHNYGNPTIGARSDIENVPIERLQAFYRKYYQPDNAILVIAGRFEPTRALALVAEKFGAIPRPDRTGENRLFTTYTAEPAQDGERRVTLRRVGDVQLVMAAYHVPAGSHEQFAAVSVLAHVLSARPSGRLYKNLVKPGLAAWTGAWSYQLKEPGVLITQAKVRENDSLDEAAQAMLATLDELVAAPPTEEEVERAKADFLAGFELAFNNPQGIALQLSEWASMGDWRLLFLHRDRLEAVTPEAVHEIARTYLEPSNRTIGYFYPTEETPARSEVPASPDVAALLAGYTGREAVTPGEAFDPTPENIERRTKKITLSSGIEVALLPKKNRGGAVSMSSAYRQGTEGALMGKSIIGQMAGSMLPRGTTRRSRQEIQDEFVRLKAQYSWSASASNMTVSINTVRENLAAVIRLYGEILRAAAFDPEEFELLREELLESVESRRSEPRALVRVAVARHVSPWPKGHPYYTSTFDERIDWLKAATVTEARAFWELFYGGEGGTIAIVGDFDPDEIIPVLEEVYRDWNAQEPYRRIDEPYREVETIAVDIETPDKTNAVMNAVQVLRMRSDHPDFPALVLGNYMFGGGFLNSRLATRIRQQDGLSYGVGARFSAHPIDEIGKFGTYAIFAPENADKVVAAFREELAKVLESGFTAEEVEAAKRGYLDRAQNRRSGDSAVAATLAENLFLDRTMEFIADQEAAIATLTPGDILAALKRHIAPGRISIFRGGDFANKLAPQGQSTREPGQF